MPLMGTSTRTTDPGVRALRMNVILFLTSGGPSDVMG